LGLSGSTGHSSGPHLHLEVHDTGVPVNPLILLK
jgi:murein DD-endopeptidase MepM/ murein hydrolase activator NlpD